MCHFVHYGYVPAVMDTITVFLQLLLEIPRLNVVKVLRIFNDKSAKTNIECLCNSTFLMFQKKLFEEI
ncbi:Protein of unknown function [Gryllus bimaculatus]|nr:Protein of unknown function [Gryllus bimaculatus]